MTEAPTATVVDRLLDAAQKLLATKGIRATTVSEVAEAAGVSRAWLYRHFPDKTALLGAAIVRLTDAFWTDARAELDTLDTFGEQVTAGVRIGRGAYDDPGTLLMRLRLDEPGNSRSAPVRASRVSSPTWPRSGVPTSKPRRCAARSIPATTSRRCRNGSRGC